MSGEYDRDQASAGATPVLPSNGASDPTTTSPTVTSSAKFGTSTGSGPTTSAAPTNNNNIPALAAAPPKVVDDVLYSDIGITTLLTRLKQSIASARDFAQFLKKRSALEEEQATGLKRLAQRELDNVRKAEVRGGSYAVQLAEVLRVHERMSDNGMQFALSLHQMHEDLDVLSNNMEKGRKNWKHEGLDAEKRASDAEAAMQKAKAKYDGLAEDYDRARTGDTKGSKRLGLKGMKNAEQYEQDLLRKVQTADADYEEKVTLARQQRESLLREGRPRAVKALKELVQECDSGLALQLQKFATFNEKLLLGNGLVVSPLNDKEGAATQRSLRELVSDIDNERDFHGYVGGFSGRVQPPSEIKYEKHPTLVPRQQQQQQQPLRQNAGPTGLGAGPQPVLAVNTSSSSQPGSSNNRYASPQGPPAQQQGSAYNQPLPNPPQDQQSAGGYRQAAQAPYNNGMQPQPPYPVHGNERAGPPGYGGQTTGSIPASATSPMVSTGMMSHQNQQYTGYSPGPAQQQQQPPVQQQQQHFSPPQGQQQARPLFGVALDTLFTRDASAVPHLVVSCISAVETFGLDTEGIYRISGNIAHVNQLRHAFDNLPPSAPQLDFNNPANFHHDIHTLTTLLKSFFRDLPDPLFTTAAYTAFIDAARIEDEGKRRDALHQCINDLPDPNYATMRALVLHLWKVMQREGRNRMGGGNLGVCWAPSLMGQHTGAQIADAGLQAKVVDTILVNATAIFDED